MRSGRDLVVCAALIAVGAWITLMWALTPGGKIGFDIYSYYVPNMLYAVQRLAGGGSGLLWNPFQHCGQPSFGIGSTGPLYPANLLFHLLDSDRALRAVIVFNFAVAGLGMYALGRELGTGRAAAFCAAVAFELGPATIDLGTWSPMVSSPYVWTPVAMLFCERLLRRGPALRDLVGLGVTVTIALLPGFPQWIYMLYQLIALRVLFEFVTRRVAAPWRMLGAFGVALLLGPLLDAVQLIPSVESAALSIRGGSLNQIEMLGQGLLSWATLRQTLGQRRDIFNPIIILPCVIASASWLRTATRRLAVFYALAAVVYFVLAFGPQTPLFRLYMALPFGSLFREPARLTWMTSFCLAVLAGLGADAMVRPSHGARRWRPIGLAACAAAVLLGLAAYSPNGLRPLEWGLGAAVVAAPVIAVWGVIGRRVASATLAGAVGLYLASYPWPVAPQALNDFAVRQFPLRRLLPDDDALFTHRDVFAWLHSQLTGQERVHFVHALRDFGMVNKLASIYALPSVDDYEPQPPRRVAEYIVMMRTGRPMTSLNQYYYPAAFNFAASFRKRLLDLAAVRYVAVGADVDNSQIVKPALVPYDISHDRKVTIYENAQVLPRARFVPGLAVVPDAAALLKRLAYGSDELSRLALVEEPPADGFLGDADLPADAPVDIVTDDPEHVVLRITAPQRGFLVLADQYFPGWFATVNGEPMPILRANFLFRAVAIPAGESTVEFRYAPASLRIGAAITASTGLALLAVVALRRRARASRVPAGSRRAEPAPPSRRRGAA